MAVAGAAAARELATAGESWRRWDSEGEVHGAKRMSTGQLSLMPAIVRVRNFCSFWKTKMSMCDGLLGWKSSQIVEYFRV